MSTDTNLLFKVIVIDSNGEAETHTDGFYTMKEAEDFAEELQKTFPDCNYWAESYEPRTPKPWENRSFQGVIDGHNDLYPDYD